MKFRLYSVFDRNALFFGAPVQSQNDEMLKRSLVDLFIQEKQKHVLEQHMYVRWPDAFDVYYVGDFDSDNGVLSGAQPVIVYRMADFTGA